MRTPDRLGELRAQIAPAFVSQERFDGLLTLAKVFHDHHAEEDPDLHLAHLMQIFVEAGVPAFKALPVINELVLDKQPAEY